MASKNDETPTTPSEATRDAEAQEGEAPHRADRSPTVGEEEAAEALQVDPTVAEHEKEMNRLGAEVKGSPTAP